MSLLSHYVEGNRAVHRHGDEVAWEKIGIDPSVAARSLWLETHRSLGENIGPVPRIADRPS
jgi:hypothetical protein